MKRIICCALLLMPLLAQAFPKEIEKQLNGSEISASVIAIDHNLAGLQLYNYGGQAALHVDAVHPDRFSVTLEIPA